jgi:hypothetical protein
MGYIFNISCGKLCALRALFTLPPSPCLLLPAGAFVIVFGITIVFLNKYNYKRNTLVCSTEDCGRRYRPVDDSKLCRKCKHDLTKKRR